MTMTIRFKTQPATKRVAPKETLLVLIRTAVDVNGREWPAGTQLQPLSHGNTGVTYTLVREVIT